MKFECSRRALVITCAGAPTLSSAVEDMDDEFAKMLDDLEEVPEETSSPGSQPIADEVICLLGEEEPTSSLPSSSSSSPPNKTSSFVKVNARTRPAARRRGERKPGVRGTNANRARPPWNRRSSEKLVPLMPDSHAHDFPCVLALPQSAKRKRTIKQKVSAPSSAIVAPVLVDVEMRAHRGPEMDHRGRQRTLADPPLRLDDQHVLQRSGQEGGRQV